MIGSGGDQAARQDMFPTEVSDWQTERGSGRGDRQGIVVRDHRQPDRDAAGAAGDVRDTHPELATGATIVRRAKNAVLVVSRIDLATGEGSRRRLQQRSDAGNRERPDRVLRDQTGADDSTGLRASSLPRRGHPEDGASETEAGGGERRSDVALPALGDRAERSPRQVWFAIRRTGGAWQRVAADDSAPYRAFLEPGRFHKHERVQGVAVARGTDGSVAASPLASFVPNP